MNVIYGSAAGLTATDDQIWHQNKDGILGVAEAIDFFGRTVTAGDIDGDGRDDLVIGVPLDDVGDVAQAGAVNVIYGGADGLNPGIGNVDNQLWHRDSPGILGASQAEGIFGAAVTLGDFNGDGFADLAVQVGDGINNDQLELHVIYGTSAGLSPTGNRIFSEDTYDPFNLPVYGSHDLEIVQTGRSGSGGFSFGGNGGGRLSP